MGALFVFSYKPYILQQSLRGYTLVDVDIEHLLEDADAVISQIVSDQFYSTALNTSVQLCVSLTLERKVTIQETEQKYPRRPDVCWWSEVFYPAYDFRSHV